MKQPVLEIGTLQMDSKEMAKRVSLASEDTRQSGQKLNDMAGKMQGLVQSLRQQTEQIVEESKSQTTVAADVSMAQNQRSCNF